jgi:hypothetical protein
MSSMAPKISFYFDEHMPRAVARGLAQFEIRVVMAVDVEMVSRDDDTEHLPFAGRASKRSDHAGLVCWTGSGDDFGGMIRRLAQFVDQNSSEIVQGSVFWIK